MAKHRSGSQRTEGMVFQFTALEFSICGGGRETLS
jgi:hypothetical protein